MKKHRKNSNWDTFYKIPAPLKSFKVIKDGGVATALRRLKEEGHVNVMYDPGLGLKTEKDTSGKLKKYE